MTVRRIMRIAVLLAAMMMIAACGAAQEEKVVYLTFDDGPKADTPELLALLDELDVPATFFLVGGAVKSFPEHAKMIYDEGHVIGCHSMWHWQKNLRRDAQVIGNELASFTKLMKATADPSFETDLFRFPGGSTGYSSYARGYVAKQGYAWFDWNAMTGDTLPNMGAQEVYDYVVDTAADEEVVILLAHEGKAHTRAALPRIVSYFRERGYEFRTLSTDESERKILERCPANMRMPEIEEE